MKDLQRYFLMDLPLQLKSLKADAERQFGEMSLIEMLDHLRKGYHWCYSGASAELTIPEDLIPKAVAFLESDKPIRPGAAMPSAYREFEDKSDTLEEMKFELLREMVGMLAYFEAHPDHTQVHPNFGLLNVRQWLQLNKKHTEHHLRQFGIESIQD